MIGTPHNPFSACYVRPGAIPWLGDLEALYVRWKKLGCCAQIVGPLGSGKSTLLSQLVNRAARDGITMVALDDATVRSPLRVQYARFRHRCLLVTAHYDLGLKTLCQLHVDVENARLVIAHLLRETPSYIPSDATLVSLLTEHRGNFREVLFALYDYYERMLSPSDSVVRSGDFRY